jgi:hypothetical protein
VPALVVGEMGIWTSGVLFAVNVFWALRATSAEPAPIARPRAV